MEKINNNTNDFFEKMNSIEQEINKIKELYKDKKPTTEEELIEARNKAYEKISNNNKWFNNNDIISEEDDEFSRINIIKSYIPLIKTFIDRFDRKKYYYNNRKKFILKINKK